MWGSTTSNADARVYNQLWAGEQRKTIHGNEGKDIGVIAQEIERVLPEVVTTRDTGFKAVKYEKIVALLIEAIKEQQIQIDQLKNG